MRNTIRPYPIMTPNLRFIIASRMKQPPGTRLPSSTRSLKVGIVIVTISFDGCSDSGQVEDVQANTQDELVALPSDQIEYEHIRWGETEPTRSSCSLRDALEDLALHYLSTAHDGWENGDGAFGEFTFDTSTRSITLAYNERFTDSIYSEHEF
jgi:hypothetical protein